MEELLDQHIKVLIERYPEIAKALEKHSIGCSTCALGSCRLRDVVEMHPLSPENEHALFESIAQIVYPGQHVIIPALPRRSAGFPQKSISPPMQMLVEEHRHILSVVGSIPTICELFESDPARHKALVTKSIDFIRKYADKFHHAKEEDILFKLFDADSEILVTMHKEHEIGRAHVRASAKALEDGLPKVVTENLTAYGNLLSEHIRKEDDILYPWMDRQLTDTQIGLLYSQFLEVERSFGDSMSDFVNFARSLSEVTR